MVRFAGIRYPRKKNKQKDRETMILILLSAVCLLDNAGALSHLHGQNQASGHQKWQTVTDDVFTCSSKMRSYVFKPVQFNLFSAQMDNWNNFGFAFTKSNTS